jgi:hypothetical protein
MASALNPTSSPVAAHVSHLALPALNGTSR